MIRLKLSWPGQYVTVSGQAFKDLSLELLNDGKVVDSVPAISGGPGRQNEPFVSPPDDWAGSNRPIPEGVYQVGAVAKGAFGDGIGNTWIPLTVYAEFQVNNRSAFGFHLDNNAATAPGSAGCVVFHERSQLDQLLGWLSDRSRPNELIVDWRTGFLAEHGYEALALNGSGLTSTPETPNQISTVGLKLVKDFEGCEKRRQDGSIEAYRDPAGVLTIGFGHTDGVTQGQVINQEQADAFLVQDMRKHEMNVRRLVKVPLIQQQFDALVSFDFNLGALNVSTMLKLLNRGNYAAAADEFPRWNKATDPRSGLLVEVPGLTRRRKSEQHLYLTGELNTFQ
jgi:lysozyme